MPGITDSSLTERPLFSVIVLTYMQRHLLKECIDSIFEQDYPNIELVICDDCSADFDPDEVHSYILNHKPPNIKNVVVVKQRENMGTCENARLGVQLSSGTFFKLHAGDDMLYGGNVLTRMAHHLKKPDVNIVAARSIACQHDGTMTGDFYPAYGPVEKMMNADAQEQFTLMATQAWGEYVNAPAVFWRREFYDEIGELDPKYKYTEDWPMWLKITGAGYRITSINDATTIYRYGGISNDKSDVNMSLGKAHYEECIRMLEEDALPIFEQRHQKLKVLRCKQSIWCLKARITYETQWENWYVMQRFAWKCKNAGHLFLSWLYRRASWGVSISLRKEAILAVGIGLIYHFHMRVWPTVDCDALWATLLLGIIMFMALKIVFYWGAKCALVMFNLIKRRKK